MWCASTAKDLELHGKFYMKFGLHEIIGWK